MVVNPDSIDSTSTSMFFIGKQTTSYGQPQEQSTLWMLENFANTAQPAPAILGQEWFNSIDNKMYVCTDEGGQLFEKVSKPIVSASAPVPSVNLQQGDLWYNTTDGRVYVYTGSVWTVVGPQSPVPLNVDQSYYFTGITNNATPQEIFINGIPNSRLVMSGGPSFGQTWQFEVRLVGRCGETISENLSMIITGTIDKSNTGVISLNGGTDTEVFNITNTLTTANAVVSADVVNNSLKVTVIGQIGKTILWNAVVRTIAVFN